MKISNFLIITGRHL